MLYISLVYNVVFIPKCFAKFVQDDISAKNVCITLYSVHYALSNKHRFILKNNHFLTNDVAIVIWTTTPGSGVRGLATTTRSGVRGLGTTTRSGVRGLGTTTRSAKSDLPSRSGNFERLKIWTDNVGIQRRKWN